MDRIDRRGTRTALARATAPLALMLAVLVTPAAGEVTVVQADGTPGQLQLAVDNAADGDILLLRGMGAFFAFDFASATISGKSLTLVADPVATPVIVSSLRIDSVPAGGTVVARGLQLGFDAGLGGGGRLVVGPGDGHVLLDECVMIGHAQQSSPFVGTQGETSVLVHDASLTLVRCTVTGGTGSPSCGSAACATIGDGGIGVHADGAQLALQECDVEGGLDGKGSQCHVGLLVTDSDALVQGGSISLPCGGGTPVYVEDATSSLTLFDTAILPSEADIVAPAGTVILSPTVARSMRLPSPLREHEAGILNLRGVSGDVFGFYWSPEADLLPLSPAKGWFGLGTPLLGAFDLTVLPAETLELPFTAPGLPLLTLEGLRFIVQPFAIGVDGSASLGTGSAFVLLDGSV